MLTAPPDGTTLEQVIGELQSSWGVPQHPQEFRITLRVADEKTTRGERVADLEEVREDEVPSETNGEPRMKREKAPAAPRVGAPGSEEPAQRRRKRPRRRKRKGRGGA